MSRPSVVESAGVVGPYWQVLAATADRELETRLRRCIASKRQLNVAGVVARPADVVNFMRRHSVHLVVLDLRVSAGRANQFIDILRSISSDAEIVVISWARSPDSIRALLRRGVLDYLVAPLGSERFRQALDLFVDRASTLSVDDFDQRAVDRLRRISIEASQLPRGLTAAGIERVRMALLDEPTPVSSEQVAARTEMVRVSARRYLEHLVSIDLARAEVEMSSSSRGRPRKLYSPVSL